MSMIPAVLSPKRKSLGSTISFLVSLVIHLSATLVLSWIIISQGGSSISGISLNGTQLEDAMDSELPTFEMTASSSIQMSKELEHQPTELLQPALDANNAISPFTLSQTKNATMTSTLLEETALAIAMGAASKESEEGGGGATQGSRTGSGTSFFGARAYGNRFVFVIDSSTSMIGPRWDALRVELNRAIRSLSPDQEFFVISFDVAAHPMFDALPPNGGFLKPTQANMERLNRWVRSIVHGDATMPASAVGIALRLEPDAIFLLSDGEIRDATLFELRSFNRFEDNEGNFKVTVPIHTVLLFSEVGYLTLRSIAEENDGVFTPVTSFRASR